METAEISKILGGSISQSDRKRISKVERKLCVACGCCAKICPVSAIRIHKGIYAQINEEKCAGCAKCVAECPASIISMAEVDR